MPRAVIDEFADPGSFLEVGTFLASADSSDRRTTPGDGIVGDHAERDGRPRCDRLRRRWRA
jgi:acetyl-CoA carboxylase carboxyltransferase component